MRIENFKITGNLPYGIEFFNLMAVNYI